MLTRRTIAALMTAMLLSTIAAAPASAAKPTRPPNPAGERSLTADERAASDRRVAAAEAYARTVQSEGGDLVSLACVTPESTTSADTDAGTQACGIPQGFLGVEARDQVFGHYCGPAVGQVIANYSWAMASGVNKYTQGRIAVWMRTDATGQTDAFGMEDGLETATGGAPRRPANWDWVVTDLRDRDGDRTTGDELHTYVRSNISASRMPMAIPVKPHDFASRFYLSSWPRPVASPGHWIGIYGWYNTWDGGDRARMYFTDSSRDEGGATGKFWNPTRHIAILIGEHTRRFVW
jgi:hypothetical protein